MTVSWWERIDREEAVEKAYGLWANPGVLAVVGRDDTERGIAAKLIHERLGTCVRAVDTTYAAPLAGALLHAWRQLAPRRPGTVPDWIRYADRPPSELCKRLAEHHQSAASGTAIVLEEVDKTDALWPADVDALRSLARDIQCPVVVTSREESRTHWVAAHSTDVSVVRLQAFHAREISECIRQHRPELDFKNRRALIETARAGRPAHEIPPIDAYMVLQAA